MDEDILKQNGDLKEEVYSIIPSLLASSAEHFTACYKERGLFMAALMKTMLDNGIYDVTITADDAGSLEKHSVFISVEDDCFKLSIIFPDQKISDVVDEE